MAWTSVVVLALAALSAALGQVFFKLGASGNTSLMDFINWRIAAGLGLYLAGTAAWIYVLSFERLTNVYAFTALTFVFVYAGAVFFVGESMTTNGFIGLVLILVGLYLIGTSTP